MLSSVAAKFIEPVVNNIVCVDILYYTFGSKYWLLSLNSSKVVSQTGFFVSGSDLKLTNFQTCSSLIRDFCLKKQ